jgi:hypothetical protein
MIVLYLTLANEKNHFLIDIWYKNYNIYYFINICKFNFLCWFKVHFFIGFIPIISHDGYRARNKTNNKCETEK